MPKIKNSVFCMIFVLCFALSGGLMAATKNPAKSDRSLYPYAINSKESFDFASKLENLAFLEVLDKVNKNLDSYVSVKNPNEKSMEKYLAYITNIVLKNTQKLQCVKYENNFLPCFKTDKEALEYFQNNLPNELRAWHENALQFYENYLKEQLRLSALFPRITSEILTLNDNEIRGDESEGFLKEGEFKLTFDDGPTKKGGNTDRLLKLLGDLQVPASFFILEESKKKRGGIEKELYRGFILGYHGEVHKPHTKKEIWQNAPKMAKELSEFNGNSCVFRPPYGQRSEEFSQALKNEGCKLVLWNIDSQDWMKKMSAKEVYDRVLSLSLLYRKGIILFHDIHPKSYEILPQLIKTLQSGGASFVE